MLIFRRYNNIIYKYKSYTLRKCNFLILQKIKVAPLAVISEFQRVRKNLRKTKADLADRVETLKKSLQKIEGNRDRITHTAEDLKVKIDKGKKWTQMDPLLLKLVQ